MLDSAVQNLTSVPVLAFALGLLATSLKSDLRLPEPIYQAITIYLLLGIGIKGGVALSNTNLDQVLSPLIGTLLLSAMVPILAFYLLPLFGKYSKDDRGALAAHYGSTSLVTFTAALVFLEGQRIEFEGYLVSLLAVMEIPGILIGLWLAKRANSSGVSLGESMREVLTGKSLLLLAGGLVIGFMTGEAGYQRIEPFFGGLFTGVLALFLLELGIVAGRRLTDLKVGGLGLALFAVCFPLFAGSLGVITGQLTGLSVGGAMVLGVLAASASYIAAPAAVRLALPEASPGRYLTASLGFTFPFNLVIGIPLMLWLSSWLEGVGL
jgi:hypothetical protein